MGNYGATWEAAGYAGSGPAEEFIDSLLGRPAVVCGGARGVFEDYRLVRHRYGEDLVVFAANDVGMYLPVLHHWCSLHTDNLGAWKQVRWLHARKEVTKYHSTGERPFVDYNWESIRPLFALSGYFAMQLAWLAGCRPIILVGCPGDATPRFFEQELPSNFAYGSGERGSDDGVREQVIHEMKRLPQFKAVVRSVSGWTKEFFGGLDDA